VFFLDYDGTLTAGQHTSITLAPLEEVLQVSALQKKKWTQA
jgi:trehalose-6-phosphatase